MPSELWLVDLEQIVPLLFVLSRQVAAAFQGREYDLLTQNCNHFTIHLCQALLQRDPPRWINKLARIGIYSIAVCKRCGGILVVTNANSHSGKRVECCLPTRLKEIHVLAAEEEQHEKAERPGDDPH